MGRKAQWIDYSHEVRLIKSKPIRMALIVISGFFLALGLIGIVLPGLPTTPFVLLAAACYARSSPEFYNWLMNHEKLGPPLRRWIEHRSISKKHKTIAISMLCITLVPTIIFLIPLMAVKFLLAAIGLAVAAFILKAKPS